MARFLLLVLLSVGTVAGVFVFLIQSQPSVEETPSPAQAKISDEPRQEPLDYAIEKKGPRGFVFRLHNTFSLTARVLGEEHYSLDTGAQISPVDLALGWGPMADERVVSRLKIQQSNRFYHYRYRNPPPLPSRQMSLNSANMHFIPANKNVERTLKKVRAGDIVYIKGYLTDVRRKNSSWNWNSSRTRSDTGDGACELVYLEQIQIVR